jgi:hypothetical protein
VTSKLLESFGGKFAEQWVTTLLTPAFAFWSGGVIAAIQRWGWQSLTRQFSQYPEPLLIAILVCCFGAIALSAFIIQRFDLAVLRFLEGYWCPWLRVLRHRLIQREKSRLRKIEKNLKPLVDKGILNLNTDEQAEYVKLDWQQMYMPSTPDQLMPTRLGNILRATERRPSERYGLDAVICWPRLWLLLPDTARKDLQEARADLSNAARVWFWSLLFSIWTLLGAWWAFPIGLITACFAYYGWILDAATTYADLINAAFDVHRILLYQALRWKLPSTAAEEIATGQQLTEYLWNGSDSAQLSFLD